MTKKVLTKVSENLLGEKITLEGVAYNCKGGACFKLKNGEVIYILNKDSWEEEFFGKKIILQGKFDKKKIIPDPVIDEDGAISQGACGEQYILENCKIIKIS